MKNVISFLKSDSAEFYLGFAVCGFFLLISAVMIIVSVLQSLEIVAPYGW